MKMNRFFMFLLMGSLVFTSCSKDDDIVKVPKEPKEPVNLEVEEFMYEVMNEIYLYNAEVPELADNHFATTEDKNEFLGSFDSPTDLYYNGLVADIDDFSFMTEDYVALEKLLTEGVSGTTGMDYGLGVFQNSDDVYGYVRYVMPGSSADQEGVIRGNFFTEINGEKMTLSNYQDLLGASSFSMRIATLEGTTVTNTDKVVDLVKEEVAEDPIFISDVFELEGQKIGYLMYNGFTPSFDLDLNAVFGEFKSAGITDLILDLRYNGGGNVKTAMDLATMITGQFTDKVFIRYMYNQKYQTYFETNNPEDLYENFSTEMRDGGAINSLNLTKLYVITTRSSASASELVINNLSPYIDVVQIGTNTRGKFQASSPFYDSPSFGKDNVNPNHNYALQPLIAKYANADHETDFLEGLAPDVDVSEDYANMGVLGDPSETMLEAALNAVLGTSQEPTSAAAKKMQQEFRTIGERDMFKPNFQRLYFDNPLPRLK